MRFLPISSKSYINYLGTINEYLSDIDVYLYHKSPLSLQSYFDMHRQKEPTNFHYYFTTFCAHVTSDMFNPVHSDVKLIRINYGIAEYSFTLRYFKHIWHKMMKAESPDEDIDVVN
jgi:hypothetical protein